MKKGKIKKIVSLALASVMCGILTVNTSIPVYAYQISHVEMKQTKDGYLCEIKDPQEGDTYKIYQIFEGQIPVENGQPVFCGEITYGSSHPKAGEKVPQEVLDEYLADNSGYLDSIYFSLSNPVAELTADNPSISVPAGLYIAPKFNDSDELVGDITVMIPTNPTISGEKVDGKFSLTVKDGVAKHNYKVYQIFKGDVGEDGKTLSNVKYGSNYGETGKAVPQSELDGITDAKAFAKNLTSDNTGGVSLVIQLQPLRQTMCRRN